MMTATLAKAYHSRFRTASPKHQHSVASLMTNPERDSHRMTSAPKAGLDHFSQGAEREQPD
jgi:hypothetical protein